LSKSSGKRRATSGTVADQVAEFIGRTMGELLNRKDALTRQMADVDQQIADVRQRVVRQFGEYLPTSAGRRGVRQTVSTRVKPAGASAREVSEETRKKMADAARKRWARERGKKAKVAKAAK
jgi:hypothetical protein